MSYCAKMLLSDGKPARLMAPEVLMSDINAEVVEQVGNDVNQLSVYCRSAPGTRESAVTMMFCSRYRITFPAF